MTASTLKPMRVVCCWDPAIDLAHPDTRWHEYIDHRDIDLLKLRTDPKPQVFVLRALSSRLAIQRLLTITNAQEARMAAFRACVIRIENPRIEGWDSPKFVPQAVSQAGDNDLSSTFELLNQEELELFEPATILEIGEVAYGRAMLPKETKGGYVLPPGSQRLLIVMRDLLADAAQKRAEAEATSQHPSPSESEREQTSDASGDATATDDLSRAAAATVASRLVDSSS